MEKVVSFTLTTVSDRENSPVSMSKKLDGHGSKWKKFSTRMKTYKSKWFWSHLAATGGVIRKIPFLI
jgi:hypothetical protein